MDVPARVRRRIWFHWRHILIKLYTLVKSWSLASALLRTIPPDLQEMRKLMRQRMISEPSHKPSSSTKSTGSLRKTEILEYLVRLGVADDTKVLERWTVPELRELLKKHQQQKTLKPADPMRGLASLRKAELAAKCEEMRIAILPNMTKGQMLLEIRSRLDPASFSTSSQPSSSSLRRPSNLQNYTVSTPQASEMEDDLEESLSEAYSWPEDAL